MCDGMRIAKRKRINLVCLKEAAVVRKYERRLFAEYTESRLRALGRPLLVAQQVQCVRSEATTCS
jgi:hypothetical protein